MAFRGIPHDWLTQYHVETIPAAPTQDTWKGILLGQDPLTPYANQNIEAPTSHQIFLMACTQSLNMVLARIYDLEKPHQVATDLYQSWAYYGYTGYNQWANYAQQRMTELRDYGAPTYGQHLDMALTGVYKLRIGDHLTFTRTFALAKWLESNILSPAWQICNENEGFLPCNGDKWCEAIRWLFLYDLPTLFNAERPPGSHVPEFDGCSWEDNMTDCDRIYSTGNAVQWSNLRNWEPGLPFISSDLPYGPLEFHTAEALDEVITSVYKNITQFATLLNRELLSSPSKASDLADEGARVARDANKVFTALLTPPPSSQSRTKAAYVIGQWTFGNFMAISVVWTPWRWAW